MLSEKELRFLIKKKLMLKEALLAGSGAGQNAGVNPKTGGAPTKQVTTTGGTVSPGGASVPPFFSSTGTNNDEKDFKALEKTLDLERPPMKTGFTDQQHKDYQKDVVAKIMEIVNANSENAEKIFGSNPEEKINRYYTKQLTTQDLFADSDPTVQAALADMASRNLVRYDPAAITQTTWSTGTAGANDNFPFYWLKFMIDRKFKLSKGKVNFDKSTGYPLFNNTDKLKLNKETGELYTKIYDRFKASYEEYLNAYYQLRSGGVLGGGGINDYFDNSEGLAYVQLLNDLIENDYDPKNLPMTRMFFARISAEAYTGYSGGEDYEEARAMFAVGEDSRARTHLASNTPSDLASNARSVFGGLAAIGNAGQNYAIPYEHVATDGFGDRLDRFNPFTTDNSDVDDAKTNLSDVINGILTRKMDKSAALAKLNAQSVHKRAYDKEIGEDNLFIEDESGEGEKLKESKIREIIRKHLLIEKKSGTKNVGLDAEFDSLVDPRGYVFVHFGKSKATISPKVYTKPKDTSSAVRASDLYRLCYYSPHWLTVGGKDNPLTLDPFDMLYALYEAVELDDGFDLNNVAVFPASKILQIGNKLQGGSDPTGSKTTPPYDPAAKPPPTSAELTAFQNALVTGPHAMEAMRVKEVANSIFAGIRKDEGGKGTKFLKYMESQKSKIMVGKNLDKTYEAALEKGLKDPGEAAQQEKDKDSISKMYEFLASMKEFGSSDKSALLAERDKALAANKMELDKIKTAHPLFNKGFLILMQKKIAKGGKLSYDDMLRMSDDFKNTASVFNLMPNISGLYSFFNNLKRAPEVSGKDKIKVSAAAGTEIKFDRFTADIFNRTDTVLTAGASKSDYTFEPIIDDAMSEFASLLKDSDNTLNQPIVIVLDVKKGGVAPNIKIKVGEIKGRMGGNIKLGLRRWINKKLIPSIGATPASPHKLFLTFPAARYIGKGLSESDISRELIQLIREYSS